MRTTLHALAPVAALGLLPATARADAPDAALALVRPDAVAAFVVPSLKRASDDLDSCLERVDRAEALLVGRPLDLLKARLGASVGVRDDGALVGFLRWPEGQTEPTATLLVPVTDAEAFLSGNFDPEAPMPGGSRMVRRSDGTRLAARTLQVGAAPNQRVWMALSNDVSGVDGLDAPANAEEVVAGHRARLGESGERLLREADLLAWIDGPALRRLAASRATVAAAELEPEAKAAAQQAAEKASELLAGVQVAAMAWNIDALGLLGRGVVRIDPASRVGALFAGAADPPRAGKAGDRLDRLPDQPFYAAVGVDLVGLGGPMALQALRSLAAAEGQEAVAAMMGGATGWLEGLEEVQLAVFPSKLGITVGGILNDAALALRASDPGAVRSRLKATLESLVGDRDGVVRTLAWESDRPIKEGGLADAFELKESPSPTAPADVDLQRALLRSLALGNRGWHGLLKPLPERGVLVATFSQRPDVWRRAVAAATGDAKPLGGNATLAAMREFGLVDPDMELAVGLTQLVKLAQQVAKSVPGGEGLVPPLDAGTEPIYAALEASPDRLEAAWVVPSAVVGLAIDQAKRSVPGPAPAPPPPPPTGR